MPIVQSHTTLMLHAQHRCMFCCCTSLHYMMLIFRLSLGITSLHTCCVCIISSMPHVHAWLSSRHSMHAQIENGAQMCVDMTCMYGMCSLFSSLMSSSCTHLSLVRTPPAAGTPIHREECTQCFANDTSSDGLDVCATCWNGGMQHAQETDTETGTSGIKKCTQAHIHTMLTCTYTSVTTYTCTCTYNTRACADRSHVMTCACHRLSHATQSSSCHHHGTRHRRQHQESGDTGGMYMSTLIDAACACACDVIPCYVTCGL